MPFLSASLIHSTTLSLPKCGKGKPALVRRNTVDDKNELIACIENGNFARAARIAAGELVVCAEALPAISSCSLASSLFLPFFFFFFLRSLKYLASSLSTCNESVCRCAKSKFCLAFFGTVFFTLEGALDYKAHCHWMLDFKIFSAYIMHWIIKCIKQNRLR